MDATDDDIVWHRPWAIFSGDEWQRVICFPASNLGDAIQVVNQMLDWRLADDEPTEECSEEERELLGFREYVKCKIFLGFTSNLISSGVRETVRFLVEHRMVDVVVTTAGGIEEDLIKRLAPTYRGEFSLCGGASLPSKGLNRMGNLLVPNDNYCKFEDWIIPIFEQMLQEQFEESVLWTPSKVIARLGKEINDPSSYLYWASKLTSRPVAGERDVLVVQEREELLLGMIHSLMHQMHPFFRSSHLHISAVNYASNVFKIRRKSL
ncbi:hypothetical protein MRB53_029288 [Persea americana]|uniref:Uncharacterized protein n=1 Tax=Persea americana TaxID=3435 RepID=A0ACC2KIJ4_PERAE|nr:hypothetical protein MRB53_029288 [Persea americana]